MRLCLIVTTLVTLATANQQEQSLQFCEAYVECAAVSLLEERLCFGNSRLRPFWLPESNPHGCYEKLKNDYKRIAKYELELDNEQLSCLIEKSNPDATLDGTCDERTIKAAPRFTSARSIDWVPTHCFTGVERRTIRQCGKLKQCCQAVPRCEKQRTESAIAKQLDEYRVQMRKRAEECRNGKPISPISWTEADDATTESAYPGNVTVHFTNNRAPIQPKTLVGKMDGGAVTPGFKSHGGRFQTQDKELLEELKEDTHIALVFPSETTTPSPVVSASLNVSDPSAAAKIEVRLPTTLAEHNAAFDKAMSNTVKIQHRAEVVDEALSSLLASAGSTQTTEEELGLLIGRADKTVEGRGFVNQLVRDDWTEGAVTVTSEPILIFQSTTPVPTTPAANETGTTPTKLQQLLRSIKSCRQKGMRAKARGAKTVQMDAVISLLSEDMEADGDDMKDILSLIDVWNHETRGRLLAAKGNATGKVESALQKIVDNFDEVNLEIIRHTANATWHSDEEYPDADAEIAASECEPLPEVEADGDRVLAKDADSKLVIDSGNLVLEAKTEKSKEEEKEVEEIQWDNAEYKKELEAYKKEHNNTAFGQAQRRETSCDSYMRCKNQMHLALDGCAWRFASIDILPSLAESAESLLYKGDDLCNPDDRPLYESLYDLVISRNNKIRKCLDVKNEKYFADSLCIPYPSEKVLDYDAAMLRILSADYANSGECFRDANLIQEKCGKLRDCCPNFDACRDSSLDVNTEQAIISKTAQINEKKQDCLRDKARDAFRASLRDMLGKGRNFIDKVRRAKTEGAGPNTGSELLMQLLRRRR